MSNTQRRRASRGARAFAALLALYPAAFRDDYGREMTLAFADRYRDTTSTLDRVQLWLEVLQGLVTEAPQEHLRMILADLRYACRRLRHSPGFALGSIATLALAIGVSTAMFSVLNAVLLRPLPFEDPERLVFVTTAMPSEGVRGGRVGYSNVEQWRRESQSFTDLAGIDGTSVTLSRGGELDQIVVSRASPNVFTLLGLRPIRGRLFTAREAEERQRLAVIGHGFWQTRFGGSDEAIGATIEIDGAAAQIVGVLPGGLEGTGFAYSVWEPHTAFPDWEQRRAVVGAGAWFVLGRLKPDVSLAQAQTEMNAIARRLDAQQPPAQRGRVIELVPLERTVVGTQPRLVLWMLTAATVLLLAVAAANVAGLSLARSVSRVPEMAVRAALGASRGRIARLLLAESVTLATAAGALGVGLAACGVGLIRAYGPSSLSRLQEASLDWRVVAWALAISLAAGLLVGLAPAVTLWRRDLRSAGANAGRGIAGSPAVRVRSLLVVAECAVAITLLAGAGLLMRSWWNLLDVDAGFRSARVISLALAAPPGMPPAQRAPFFEIVLEQVGAVPGIERAGIGSELFVGNVSEQVLTAEGSDHPGGTPLQLRRDEVIGGFFETLGTPLVRGRFLSPTDGPGAPPVVVINEAMAARVWPGRDPIGRRLMFGSPRDDAQWFTVVGVVGDMRRQGLEIAPVPQVFESMAQNPSPRVLLFARTTADDPLQLAAPLGDAVRRADARALVYGVDTLDARIGAQLAQRRLQTVLLAGFSTVALLLATIGIYGLVQYSVASRTYEIGIRMALGAHGADIFRMVVREGLVLTAAGLAFGLIGAWWVGRAGSSLLFGVTATDPLTFAGIALLLVAVGTAACCIPARRAMRVPPVVALQERGV